MSGTDKDRARGENAPEPRASAAFGVNWADVTGQWEGLITTVGSSVGGLLPVVEPGSLVAASGHPWSNPPQGRIGPAPHAEGKKAGGHRKANTSREQKALAADPVIQPPANEKPVHTSNDGRRTSGELPAARQVDQVVDSHTDHTLNGSLPAGPGRMRSQTKAQILTKTCEQRPQEREKDKHRSILKEMKGDDKYESKAHRTSPVEITSKPTRGVRMSRLHLALTSSVDGEGNEKKASEVTVGEQATQLRNLSNSNSHATRYRNTRFSGAEQEERLFSRPVPDSSLAGNESSHLPERAARDSTVLAREAVRMEAINPDAENGHNKAVCADVLSSEAMYPCTDAVVIQQRDIYDGGLPPEARAPLQPHNVTKTFVVSSLSAENIPSQDRYGKSDAFVQARSGPVIRRSKTKKNVTDCAWEDEEFVFIYPQHVVEAVMQGDYAESSLSISLLDEDAFSSDFIGHADIDLVQILSLNDDGQDFVLPLSNHGELVTDHTGQTTRIFLHIERARIAHEGWRHPTLGALPAFCCLFNAV